MDEEKTNKLAGQNSNVGNQSEETPLIERANAAAERLEGLIKVQAEQIAYLEKEAARRVLGGGSQAGLVPSQPKELTPQEYAEKVRKGEINPFKV